ncbi:MAG TPA: hypothetical protein VEA37_13320 [Flavobacterium sp.]|nr:hypothetical protein [Flavobacterium sp.]
MINLIPNEEKKAQVRNFYSRLFVVFLYVISFSILLSSATILPAYFLSRVKKDVAVSQLEAEVNNRIKLSEETLSLSADLEKKLQIVEAAQGDKYVVSQAVINKILLKKMNDIKIKEIDYKNEGSGKIISIFGTAPNRERLLLFRQALEDDVSFKEVNLPISNFVRGSNIEFSLTLKPY